MNKAKVSPTSLLTKYSQLYEKNPKSRVFAPLAESYRKIGMLDESLKILRKGIKLHPSYTLGYIVLAHCYFDKELFELAYNTLRPFVAQNLENLSLQKLFGQVCVKLGYLEEALNAYKNLLLVNPRDQFVAEQVKLLEDDLLVAEEESIPTSYNRRLEDSVFADDEDDWVQVDFNKPTQERRGQSKHNQNLGDEWSLVSPSSSNRADTAKSENTLEKFKSDLKEKKIAIEEHELDDTYFWEEYDNPAEETIEADKDEDEFNSSVGKKPIITHTLVDLYCRQGHYQQALEILDSILELHPTDQATIAKLEEVKLLASSIHENDNTTINEPTETDGHNELLSLIDETKKKENKRLDQVKHQLMAFLEQVRLTAKSKNGESI